MKTDNEIIESLRQKIQEEEEQEKEKSYLSPEPTKRSTSIYPTYEYIHPHITKIANSDLSSKFNINGEKEILFGNNPLPYTTISQRPEMKKDYYDHRYEMVKNIDNNDIVYIHRFIEASTELTDICNGLCTNPYGFGKVIANDYGNNMLVHFGIYNEENCIYLVPRHFLHFHARPSLITTEWFMSNDEEGFKIQQQINEPIYSRSLLKKTQDTGPPREPFTTKGEEMSSKPFPKIRDGYKTPTKKGGFSKTIKNNKNKNNKTLKAGKPDPKRKNKKGKNKQEKNKTVGHSLLKIAALNEIYGKEISEEDKEKLNKKYEKNYNILKYYNIKSKPCVVANKDNDTFLLFLSDNKKEIKLNE